MKNHARKILYIAAALLLCFGMMRMNALADDGRNSSIRLLEYEGEIEILNEKEEAVEVTEDFIFSSGDILSTGEKSTASVELAEERIVTLDEKTSVGFVQDGDSLKLVLIEGTILLDVQNKLTEKESLDIETPDMTVGIRGTIVYLTSEPEEGRIDVDGSAQKDAAELSDEAGAVTMLGVLDGTADIRWTDSEGTKRVIEVPAGTKAVLDSTAEENAGLITAPVEMEDITAFVRNKLTDEKLNLVNINLENGNAFEESSFPADGDWLYTGEVVLVAQSASRLYTGSPLTDNRILVHGLPGTFTVRAEAGGSQTDAGSSENAVTGYTIFNAQGEDVTSHFTGVTTVSGTLVVEKAPLTVWTGSAEKPYDGTPLICEDAEIRTVAGLETDDAGRNLSYILSGGGSRLLNDDTEKMYGISGEVVIQGTDPITQETRQDVLKTGEMLTVRLDQAKEGGIEFVTAKMSESDLPAEILQFYADNPQLLSQACQEAGWDAAVISELIKELPAETEKLSEDNGLIIREKTDGTVVENAANLQLNVNSGYSGSNVRTLEGDEVCFVPVTVDSSIKVTATGSQTEIGESLNTYEIYWGSAHRDNYAVTEDLGILTVTDPGNPGQNTSQNPSPTPGPTPGPSPESGPVAVTIATGSVSREYDGTPLTCEEVTLTGFPSGKAPVVTATGTITDVGSAANTYEIDWGSLNPSDYTVTENLGTLEVTPNRSEIVITSGSSSSTYFPNYTLTDNTCTVTGLPEGFSVEAEITGEQHNGGSSENTIAGYIIYNQDKEDKTEYFPNVTLVPGTLTVEKKKVQVRSYLDGAVDGKVPYTGSPYDFSINWTGIYNADNPFTGVVISNKVELKDAGSHELTYSAALRDDLKDNYELGELSFGNVEITPAELTVTTGSGSKDYDGSALTVTEGASLEGFVGTDTATLTVTGSRTDFGNSDNTYTIDWGEVNPANYTITEKLGTLTVEKQEVTFDLELDEFVDAVYTGSPWIVESISGAFKDDSTAECVESELSYDSDWVAEAAVFTFKLKGSDVVELSCKGVLNAGDYTITPGVKFDSGNADNYEISFVNNEWTIHPAELTITTGSAGRLNDGSTLTCTDVTVEGLAPGEKVTITVTGAQTGVGSSENTVTITWDGSAEESNYTVTTELGTLLVYSGSIRIDVGGSQDAYNRTIYPEDIELYFEGSDEPYPYDSLDKDGDTLTAYYNLHDGNGITVTVQGVGSNPGTYPITADVDTDGDDSWMEPVEYTNTDIIIGGFVFSTDSLLYTSSEGTETEYAVLNYDKAWEKYHNLCAQNKTPEEILNVLLSAGYIKGGIGGDTDYTTENFLFGPDELTCTHSNGRVTTHRILDYQKAWEMSHLLSGQNMDPDYILEQLIENNYIEEASEPDEPEPVNPAPDPDEGSGDVIEWAGMSYWYMKFNKTKLYVLYTHPDGNSSKHKILDYDKAWKMCCDLAAKQMDPDTIMQKMIDAKYVEA